MSIASDAIRHPISVHSAGILFRHDHCPFGRTLFDIFLCPLRRMLSDIPPSSFSRNFMRVRSLLQLLSAFYSVYASHIYVRHIFFPFSRPKICIYQKFFVPLHPNSKISCSGSKPVCTEFPEDQLTSQPFDVLHPPRPWKGVK